MTTSAEDFAIEGEQDDPSEPPPEEIPTGEPPPHKPVQHEARCVNVDCGIRVVYQPTASGAGFSIVECAGAYEQSFGVGPHGIPECPNGHGEMELADEQLPAAEAFALAQEKLNAPAERRLPFPAARFNPEAANESIFKQRGVVRLKLSIEESKHDAYKKAKKEREEEETVLGALIDKFEQQHDEWIAELERQEERAAAGHPDDTNLVACLFEQRNQGQACPVCRSDDLKPATARDSEAHLEEVAEVLDVRSATEVSDALEFIDILVPILTIRGWDQEQRAAVLEWATHGDSSQPRPERPKVLGTGHIASKPVDGEPQTCTQCDAVLIAGHIDGERDIDPPNYYDEGTIVGVDCAGRAKTDGHRYPKRGGRWKKPETTEGTE
jgi:hypothetical protein